jgi:hypothetical protein
VSASNAAGPARLRSFGVFKQTIEPADDPNYVVITDYLLPNDDGPYVVLEQDDSKEVEWAANRYLLPAPQKDAT